MFYKYLYAISIPEGTKVRNSRDQLCKTMECIDVLYMDTEQCDRDTMGHISDELFFLLHDYHTQMGYPMIESLYTAKIIGVDERLSLCVEEPCNDLLQLYKRVKNEKRVIYDGELSLLIDGPYVIPYVFNPVDKYRIITITGWRDKSDPDSVIDVITSSDDESSDLSF